MSSHTRELWRTITIIAAVGGCALGAGVASFFL